MTIIDEMVTLETEKLCDSLFENPLCLWTDTSTQEQKESLISYGQSRDFFVDGEKSDLDVIKAYYLFWVANECRKIIIKKAKIHC